MSRSGGAERSVIVIGASAAGLRCACRLSRIRPEWDVTVVEARETFSYAACGLPYVLSGDIADLSALRRTAWGEIRDAKFFADSKGVRVLAGRRATEIDASRKTVKIAGPDGGCDLAWDDLVLATGARARRFPGQPDHPRVRTFHVWDDVAPLHGGLARGEIGHVAIVGAGLVGCELSEAFRSLWGADVTLVEAASQPLPGVLDADVGACVARHLRESGVRLVTDAPVRTIEASDDGASLATAAGSIRADAVVVAVGAEPAVDLAAAVGVKLGATGAIAVDARLATSVPHVWACGDCIEVRHAVTGNPAHVPLGSLANRQGRVLANVLDGREDSFPPVAGAVAVKVFDWNVAAVGCTAERSRESGMDAASVWTTSHDRAHYWPETGEIHLKLVYDAGTGRVLGVQAAGTGDAVKRVDVAAQLIARSATVREFAHLEHAYAPPFAPAIEPLAVTAFAALNQIEGVEAVSPITELDGAEVLDVRQPDERESRPAPASRVTDVPLADLRTEAGLPRDSDLVVVCERGTRSAEAIRVLEQSGARGRYLGGGLRWRRAAGPGDDS